MAVLVVLPSIWFNLRQVPQKLFLIAGKIFRVCEKRFDDAIFFRRRENFGKARLGRCKRFHPKIVMIRAVLVIFQGMPCLEHRKCLAWNTGNVLLGTQGMSCAEHKECLAWNTGSVLFGTQGMSCLQHRACPVWHTKTRCQKLSGAQFHAQEENRHGLLIGQPQN